MDIKKIAVWVIVLAIVGGIAYYGYKSYSAQKSPATTTTQTAQTGDTNTPPEQVQGQEVKVGTGDEAKPGMEVSVEYTGKLTDGTVFDTNVGKAPLVFVLGSQGIIPGFQVGINGMKVGGQRLLAVPPSLAYGNQQVGTIPPNSTLVFDVTLLKVATPKPAAATPAAPAPKAN